MLNLLDRMYVGARVRFARFLEEFKKDETGVSAIVATVLLILIVVLLVAVFWETISGWFTETMDKIMGIPMRSMTFEISSVPILFVVCLLNFPSIFLRQSLGNSEQLSLEPFSESCHNHILSTKKRKPIIWIYAFCHSTALL